MLTQITPNQFNINSINPSQLESPTIELPISRINSPKNPSIFDHTEFSHPHLLPEIKLESWLSSFRDNFEGIGQNLKSLSYFDLLEEIPTINKLFNSDFQNLVAGLIEIQESLFISEKTNSLESMRDPHQKNIFENNSTFNNSDLGLTNLDILGVSQAKTPTPQDGMINYNHLLFQQNQTTVNKSNSSESSSNVRQQRNTFSETQSKPYDSKKKVKKEHSIGQNILKSLIRNLNNFSRSLSRYVQ